MKGVKEISFDNTANQSVDLFFETKKDAQNACKILNENENENDDKKNKCFAEFHPACLNVYVLLLLLYILENTLNSLYGSK